MDEPEPLRVEALRGEGGEEGPELCRRVDEAHASLASGELARRLDEERELTHAGAGLGRGHSSLAGRHVRRIADDEGGFPSARAGDFAHAAAADLAAVGPPVGVEVAARHGGGVLVDLDEDDAASGAEA